MCNSCAYRQSPKSYQQSPWNLSVVIIIVIHKIDINLLFLVDIQWFSHQSQNSTRNQEVVSRCYHQEYSWSWTLGACRETPGISRYCQTIPYWLNTFKLMCATTDQCAISCCIFVIRARMEYNLDLLLDMLYLSVFGNAERCCNNQ